MILVVDGQCVIEKLATISMSDMLHYMTKGGSTHLISSKKQLAVLTSGVRQEIADILSQMEHATVAELAAILGRPADALYYHLRLLKQAGLVKAAGNYGLNGRREALYSAAGRELRIDFAAARQTAVQSLGAIAGAMSRLGARDLRRALEDESVAVAGAGRELWMKRKTGWMTPEQLRQIGTAIEELGSTMSPPVEGARLYGVTVMFTPLNRERRSDKAKRKAVAKKKAVKKSKADRRSSK